MGGATGMSGCIFPSEGGSTTAEDAYQDSQAQQ